MDCDIYSTHLQKTELGDLNGACEDCGIKAIQKVKLKAAIKSLLSNNDNDLPPVQIHTPNMFCLCESP